VRTISGMAQRARPRRLMVKLTDSEHEALKARARAEGVPMAAVLRAGIASAEAPAERPAPTRERVLAQLAEAADGGSVPAMVALERALRLGGEAPRAFKPGPVGLDELDSIPELRLVR